ncbi:MAG: caspase family protein [Treponema sp.]|jgi:hypothetical protein|nr:caspase family protein [Treponema sp.]
MKQCTGIYGVLLAALFLLPVFSANAVPQRYALVIGNSNYARVEKLRTPANDAADIASVLGKLGYKVELKLNVGIDQMEQALIDFTDLLSLDRDNEGFFWYAGHGVQVEGENYLLPVDIQAERISQVRRAAYSLTELLKSLESARNKVNVVVLDACRNNPLPAESRSLSRGLSAAPVVQDTFVMFSTAAGATASDGDPKSRNSPFTEAFLKNIEKPLPIETVAKDIAVETIEITRVNQRPYISDNILYARGYTLNPQGAAEEEEARQAALAQAQVQAQETSQSKVQETAQVQPLPPAVQEVRPQPQPEQTRPDRQWEDAGDFTLDYTRAMNFGVSGDFLAYEGGGALGAGGGATLRFTFWEVYDRYGTLFFLPNAVFVEGNYTYFSREEDNGMKANIGHISAGFLYRIRLGAAQRFILSIGASAGPIVSGFSWNTKYDAEGGLLPLAAVGVYADLPYAELSFRFTPVWALGFALSFSGDLYSAATDGPGIGGLTARLGLAYRLPR